MHRLVVWSWLVVSLGLVAAAGWQTVRTLEDERFDSWVIYNADFLFPAALYQDLVVDGYSLDTFQFSACTFAFPDVVTYFVVRAAVGETTPAVPLWMLALVGLLLASGWAASFVLTPRPARSYLAAALLTLAAFYVAVNSWTFFCAPAANLLMPVFHSGAQISTFLGLGLTVGLMRSATRRGVVLWLLGLALLAFAAAFSDRLFGPYFVAPLAITLLVLLLDSRERTSRPLPLTWLRSALVVTALAIGCAAALAALHRLQGHTDPLDSYWGGGSLSGLVDRAAAAARKVANAALDGDVLVLIGLTGTAVWCGTIASWLAGRRVERGLVVYGVFSLAQLAVMVTVFLMSKTAAVSAEEGTWTEVSRYFVGPLASALIGLVMISAHAAAATSVFVRGLGIGVPVGLAAIAIGVGLDQPRNEHSSITDLRPPWVRHMDELCVSHDLRDGLTDYWSAKTIRLLSSQGVRPVPVHPGKKSPYGLLAYPWLANSEWFWKPPAGGEPIQYKYVLVTLDSFAKSFSLREADVVAHLGQPRLKLGNWHLVLLVYDRPADERVRRFAELNCSVLNYRHRGSGPRGPYRYPGNSLDSHTPISAATDERVADPETTAKGLMAFGPNLHPPTAGWHKARFRITSSESHEANVSVRVTCFDPAASTEQILAMRVLPAGFDDTITLDFELTRDMKRQGLHFQVFYGGTGRVVLHWVSYE